MQSRVQQWGAFALILVAYLTLYGRTVTYGYVWDDVHEIALAPLFDAPLLDGISATQTERTDPSLTELSSIRLAYDSYRPVLFASYWLEIRAWGRSPGPMHAANVLIGALAILGVFLLSRRLFGATPIALVPVTIFALHPVQVESVAYISARGDLLVGLLALATALASLRAADGKRLWIVVAALTYAAAMFAKESAIALPLGITALLWSTNRLRQGRATLIALGIAAVLYFAVRQLVTVPTTGASVGEAIVQLPGVCLEYLRITLMPFDLSTERLHSSGLVVAGWGAAVLLVGGAVYLRRRAAKLIGGTLWFIVLLGPTAVAITASGVAADRYLYGALAGLAIAITDIAAAIVRARPRLRRPLQAMFGAWGVLLVIVAWRQVPVWRTNQTLYAHATTMSPDSADAFYRLGYLAASNNDWDQALPLLEHALALDPDHERALNNFGVGLLRTGKASEAQVVLGHAVEVNPAAFRAWLNLGLARLALGQQREGCAAIARALEINPQYTAAARTLQSRCK
jgi:protein O-mannosyl-transferase